MSTSAVHACVGCRLRFASAADQYAHYETAFHRENLQRKIAQLPPLTAEAHAAKTSALAAADEAAKAEASRVFKCVPCNKSFQSRSTFASHERSKRHRERAAAAASSSSSPARLSSSTTTAPASSASSMALDDDDGAADVAERLSDGTQATSSNASSDPAAAASSSSSSSSSSSALPPRPAEDAPIDDWVAWKIACGTKLEATECFVCRAERADSLEDNLAHMAHAHGFVVPDVESCDVQALMEYLAQKVGIGHACLRCARAFDSLDAVRTHMRDSQHGRLPLDADELDEYYDFYDLASDDEDEDEDEGEGEGEDEDEDGSSSSSMSSAVALAPTRTPASFRAGEVLPSGSLQLPNGRVAVHRSLAVYYRQNVRLTPAEASVAIAASLKHRYGALGVASRRGLRALPRAERRLILKEREAKSRRLGALQKLGTHHNNMSIQRPQMMQ